ncbi:hypothetical protein FQN54_000444 [Arachnomyces sp. PD_36]|nr:hypothetical protein FQN54_000444 [Arachnomyces sp. PD_36]
MSVPGNVLRRALLYVPGSSQRMLDKSRSLVADCVAYDLEDSVTPSKKEEARHLVRQAIDQPAPQGIRERAVRINSVDSGLALGDLTEVLKSPNLTTLVIPKVNSPSDLTFITDVISHTLSTSTSTTPRSPISILALIESAKSLISLPQICTSIPTAPSQTLTQQQPTTLSGLIFAAEDFALDLSLTRTPSLTEFLYARSAISTASRAHNLPSTIDLVCTSYKSSPSQSSSNNNILESESRSGKHLGFNGKQCIHPSQLATVQEIFSPEAEEVEWAVRVVVADGKAAEREGRGAWTLDGKMIDAPVVERAKAVVRRAGECGVDVEGVREKWKGQEPE